MNTKTNNEYITLYKKQLEKGDIQIAYSILCKTIARTRVQFNKDYNDIYQTGNISFGYLDYTYFPFFNRYLRNHKLRFGIVLNHYQMRFELWLMGQNEKTQKAYWEVLKSAKWNKHINERPIYSVLETVLIEKPNFNDLDILVQQITAKAITEAIEIQKYLEK